MLSNSGDLLSRLQVSKCNGLENSRCFNKSVGFWVSGCLGNFRDVSGVEFN